MTDSLVSVVVPVYNTEKYVKKCIDSILKQSYENIELIVVNDGSKDSSRDILKSIYDERMTVIDQKNGGVSAARNKGLNSVHGKYVVFVDSDDYLAEDFIEYFVNVAEKYESDFVFSTKWIMSKQWEEIRVQESIVSNRQATAMLLDPDVMVGCWNKIYKVDFLRENKITFSNDLFYGEGLRLITTVSQIAENIVVTNAKKYFYRRNNELSATSFFNVNKYKNGEKSLLNIKQDFIFDDKKVNSYWLLHYSLFALGAVVNIISSNSKKQYCSDYKRWMKIVKQSRWKLFFNKYITLYRKMLILGGSFFPKTVAKLNERKRKKITLKSVE